MDYDEKGLGALIEHSDDIQADAMRASRESLGEIVETGKERRALGDIDPDESGAFTEQRTRLMRDGLVGVGAGLGLGAAILALSESPAFAAVPSDVQILQTAAAIENLAVATYAKALTLSFIGGSSANAVVKAFVTKTRMQHMEHAAAFNASIKALGGTAQSKPDPVLLKVVDKALPTLTTAPKVVALAITLETGAAETYVKDTAVLKNMDAKNLTASIMGVEAQHVAILLAVQALLAGGAGGDIALPPPIAKLPAAAGSVGFPNAFYSTTAARGRPPKELSAEMKKSDKTNMMGLSESELSSLTQDLADAHNETYGQMRSAVSEWSELEGANVPRAMSRRGFIATAGAMIAGGVALAAMPAAASTRTAFRSATGGVKALTPDSTMGVPLDVVVAGLAASLENLAVATYGAALKAAGAGKLGKVPPAVGTFVTTAMAQHKDHAAAWNSILQKVGYKPITVANPVLAKVVDADFAKVSNVTGVAELALTLEEAAAATYLEAIKALSTTSAVQIAASIQPVEMQHAAILSFVLGKYPVPNVFASLAGAAPVSDANGLSFAKA